MAGGSKTTMRHQAHRRASSPKQLTHFEPTVGQVLAAVSTLYDDELKPFGRILLKRLRELAAAAAPVPRRTSAVEEADLSGVAHIDPRYLRRLCESCLDLVVEPAEGKEYAVLFKRRAASFVDVCSRDDPYPAAFWSGLQDYFEHLPEAGPTLPGGRYACAQVLMARKIPVFNGRSLGEVCHIVQLAVSQRKLLGYRQGCMVPYSRSEESLKELCAARGIAVSAADPRCPAPGLRIADWSDVRACLAAILDASASPATGSITMSNVKRVFRSRFDMELSETALGHSRLCELLEDPRLRDICEIETAGNGQAIVRRAGPRQATSPHAVDLASTAGAFPTVPPGYLAPQSPWSPSAAGAPQPVVLVSMPAPAAYAWDACESLAWSGYPADAGYAYTYPSCYHVHGWGQPEVAAPMVVNSVVVRTSGDACRLAPQAAPSFPAEALQRMQENKAQGGVDGMSKFGGQAFTSGGEVDATPSSGTATPPGSRVRSPGRASWADMSDDYFESDDDATASVGSPTSAAERAAADASPAAKGARALWQARGLDDEDGQVIMVRNTFIDVSPERRIDVRPGGRSRSLPRGVSLRSGCFSF